MGHNQSAPARCGKESKTPKKLKSTRRGAADPHNPLTASAKKSALKTPRHNSSLETSEPQSSNVAQQQSFPFSYFNPQMMPTGAPFPVPGYYDQQQSYYNPSAFMSYMPPQPQHPMFYAMPPMYAPAQGVPMPQQIFPPYGGPQQAFDYGIQTQNEMVMENGIQRARGGRFREFEDSFDVNNENSSEMVPPRRQFGTSVRRRIVFREEDSQQSGFSGKTEHKPKRPTIFNSPVCKNFQPGADGFCPYKDRCQFLHPGDYGFCEALERAIHDQRHVTQRLSAIVEDDETRGTPKRERSASSRLRRSVSFKGLSCTDVRQHAPKNPFTDHRLK